MMMKMMMMITIKGGPVHEVSTMMMIDIHSLTNASGEAVSRFEPVILRSQCFKHNYF